MMAADDDYLREHQKTWSGFTKLMAWCVAGVAILLIGMALFLL